MSDVKHSGDPTDRTVTFSWDLVEVCNYRCSYCSAEQFLKKQMNTSHLNAYKQVISRLALSGMHKFKIELLGGEPTLHPHLLEIITSLNNINKCIKIELVTNLSKTEQYFQQFNIPECNKLHLNPSYHPEYFQPSFIEKCISIKKSKYLKVTPNINLSDDENRWDSTISLIQTLKDAGINIGLNFLIATRAGWKPNYTEKFFEKFKPIINDNLASITHSIPYNINGNILNLNEYDIQKNHLRFFQGFKCTPLMWHIKSNGDIVNHCTGIPLSPLASNVDASTICNISEGCDCDIKYTYHKTRVE